MPTGGRLHEARIAERFERVACPTYVVFGTADDLVDEANRNAIIERAQAHHRIDVFEGMAHSAWSVAEADEIIGRSCDFLVRAFGAELGRGRS